MAEQRSPVLRDVAGATDLLGVRPADAEVLGLDHDGVLAQRVIRENAFAETHRAVQERGRGVRGRKILQRDSKERAEGYV